MCSELTIELAHRQPSNKNIPMLIQSPPIYCSVSRTNAKCAQMRTNTAKYTNEYD